MSAPLCVHELAQERVKVAHDLLSLIPVDCAAGMRRETWQALQQALASVVQLQGVLRRQPRCGCKRHQGDEEESDETADDSDD